MFSEQEPAEQQSEWRHHEVIGTRGGRTRYRKHAEPKQVSEHRDEENQIRKRCEQAPGRSAGNRNSAGPSRAEDERRISGGVTNTELALVAAPNESLATRRLAQVLADFCSTVDRRKAAL